MSTGQFDPAEYKAGQRQEWDAAAESWRKWWETIERGGQHVSDRLVELAEIQPGHQVLDIATGIGEPAVTAARRVGAAGSVVATDQAPQMLAIARERATALNLLNVDFREMDAESLELPEASFNAVLCRWGLMFLPNLADALTGMRRLLAPGGRLAATVWGEPPKVPLISLSMGVIWQAIDMPPPPAGAPGPFSLADAGALEQALRQAGLVDVRSESMTVTFEWPSTETYARMIQDIAAPVSAMLASHPAGGPKSGRRSRQQRGGMPELMERCGWTMKPSAWSGGVSRVRARHAQLRDASASSLRVRW